MYPNYTRGEMCLLFTGSAELVIPGNVVHADNLVMHSGPRSCAQIHCIHTYRHLLHPQLNNVAIQRQFQVANSNQYKHDICVLHNYTTL